MELILTEPKDFSSKSVTYNNYVQADVYSFRYDKEESGPKRSSSDIEHALISLKKELMVVRCLGQMLVKQLMELQAGIQVLKEEYRDFTAVGFHFPKSNMKNVYTDHLFLPETSPHYKKTFRKITYRRCSIP